MVWVFKSNSLCAYSIKQLYYITMFMELTYISCQWTIFIG